MINPLKMRKILRRDHIEDFEAARNLLSNDHAIVLSEAETDMAFMSHVISGGIERVHFRPKSPSCQHPVLLQHGMWHSATCWREWQHRLASQGIETVAYSLPGHGQSIEQRPISECSISYYLRFLVDEIARFEHSPILVGHSMGGAIIQWYLRYVGDPVAAAFIASWTAHDVMRDSIRNAMFIDPLGTFLGPLLGVKFQFRSDRVVQKWFLSKGAMQAASALRPELGPESEIVLMQHRPPRWVPNTRSPCPKLWMSAGNDAIISPDRSKIAAEAYGAEYLEVQGAGHDIMLDVQAEAAADNLSDWVRRFT